ncbi:Crp/Fnr family transcriptional regulator [Parapedobacter koreensis]|uniref:cAMP-binding domain of CRP or a regulatory subunit of cAMP-dependent protein kinases n=1 Tax=Parapedobacter koreensis TaxID=332977 RepID=A0A1H7P9L4_9SPHI|nr:Crp/Fnr family transcriptional regulator [Parapedobacter koreensis]SEL32482.1 cAMP-binding domain of CRP or a regulatory subunit of cAMP-dependent protein kinases [Parapedobacter koreensis]
MEAYSYVNKSLEEIGNFSTYELDLIHKRATYRRIKRNEVLLTEGQICQSIYFLITGALYQYRMDDIDENIIELHSENEWFLNSPSFISQKPSVDTIKAYADSEILELTIYSIHQLIGLSPVFFQLGKLLQPANPRSQFFDNIMTPAEKYKHIMEERPLLLQKFPLKYIASYLKTTPETLSRIRSRR